MSTSLPCSPVKSASHARPGWSMNFARFSDFALASGHHVSWSEAAKFWEPTDRQLTRVQAVKPRLGARWDVETGRRERETHKVANNDQVATFLHLRVDVGVEKGRKGRLAFGLLLQLLSGAFDADALERGIPADARVDISKLPPGMPNSQVRGTGRRGLALVEAERGRTRSGG